MRRSIATLLVISVLVLGFLGYRFFVTDVNAIIIQQQALAAHYGLTLDE